MMSKKRLWALALLLGVMCTSMQALSVAKNWQISSPDGKLKVNVMNCDADRTTWEVAYDGVTVLAPSELNVTIDGQPLKGISKKVKEEVVNTSFATPFYKKAQVTDHYRRMVLRFKNGVDVEFRAYNDGAAYRFLVNKKAKLVDQEKAEFNFNQDYQAFIPYVNDNRGGERYCYSFESYYDEVPLSRMYADSLAITPLAVCEQNGLKAIVMDAGVEDYPGMMLKKNGQHGLTAEFAPYPKTAVVGGYDRLNLVPTERESYIAKLCGPRSLPWRAVVVTTRDADILNCDMAQRLAPACRISDTSWIKPGKVAWDWWNNLNLTGVDFKTGMNTPTYKYYIDFAAKNHLEYIIIDEGWSGKESLMEQLNPDIDLKELIAYGKERGVDIILWSSWRNLIGNDTQRSALNASPIFQHYAAMGIKGFKVDFFDRDDQQVISSAYEIAECAAQHHLLLDLHGLKPFGIQRAYPNVVNFEGVKGLENSKWEPRVGDGPLHNQPRYDVTAPYLRMLCGPMDYTPGAMTNAMRDNFFGNNDHPMSQGTRVHQMAMYVAFEAPLQMLADAPTQYERNQECTDFIARIPTTFDETVVIDGQLGEYLVIARRKGTTWYVAALTDWTPRQLTLPLTFLGSGEHRAVIFCDGINAAKDATDYRRSEATLSSADTLTLQLSSGGGWAALLLAP